MERLFHFKTEVCHRAKCSSKEVYIHIYNIHISYIPRQKYVIERCTQVKKNVIKKKYSSKEACNRNKHSSKTVCHRTKYASKPLK